MDVVAVTRSGESGRNGNAKSGSKLARGLSGAPVTRREVADYITTLLEDLEPLARQNNMGQLAYRIEAALRQARVDRIGQE